MIDTALTHHAADQQRDERFDRAMQRFGMFWTAITYVAIALNIYDVWLKRPDLLRGWSLVGLVVLLNIFGVLYHAVYMRCTGAWPMPRYRALVYFGGQLIVLALLLRYNIGFGWLGFTILGHTTSVLPPAQWPLPIIGVLLLFGAPFGLYARVQNGEWIALVDFVFNTSIIVAIFITMSLLFKQRFELSQTVRELRAAKQQLEDQATQAEELAVLRERTRLAREMHDSIGHALVAMNVKLEAAQRLYVVDATRGAAEMESIKHLVRDTMAELRRSLGDLRAPLPDHHALTTALHRLAAEVRSRSRLQIKCSTTTDLPPLAPETPEALWRVAREALVNVERHAGATRATLVLDCCNGMLTLRITDDGRGIRDHDMKRRGHYGILGMRERMDAIGGALYIAPRPDGGTVVEARVPIREE